ncbi:hypothetical protein [Micropruina sonneratiae]|uniref:hypothetical protein n=1 Tax=Micropruina sonneratiae TaxID=2986940 RepID=UPI00222660D2|nr:hypothetical protein [Micropruina sp. KQZ13P-5]MCW3157950.1 hypothetical protein [Micropruina sp. KQZ13P-5]
MIWVWVFLGIALAGVITVASYGVWLAHKAADLFSELQMIGTRAEELAELVSQVKIPSTD